MPSRAGLKQGVLSFLNDERGAVTADWVVLAAAICGLGVGTVSVVRGGVGDLGGEVQTSLTDAAVADLGCLGSNGGPDGFACYAGPTITGTGMMWGRAWMPMCASTPGGETRCDGGGSETYEQHFMSDGSTYLRITRTENGETTVSWTDDGGNPVEAPPPVT